MTSEHKAIADEGANQFSDDPEERLVQIAEFLERIVPCNAGEVECDAHAKWLRGLAATIAEMYGFRYF